MQNQTTKMRSYSHRCVCVCCVFEYAFNVKHKPWKFCLGIIGDLPHMQRNRLSEPQHSRALRTLKIWQNFCVRPFTVWCKGVMFGSFKPNFRLIYRKLVNILCIWTQWPQQFAFCRENCNEHITFCTYTNVIWRCDYVEFFNYRENMYLLMHRMASS